MLRVTKVHHSCLIVTDGETKILIDPGVLGQAPSLASVAAILVTHAHFDHFSPEIVRDALTRGIPVWAPSDALSDLTPDPNLHAAVAGETLTIGTITVVVGGKLHARLHPDSTPPQNRTYVLNHELFVTGDALAVPPAPFTAVATPINAPWLKLPDLITYIRDLRPDVVIGIHDGLLNADGLSVAHRGAGSLVAEGAGSVLLPEDGETVAIPQRA